MGMHQEAVASVFVALPSVQRFEVNPTGAPCELSNVVSASSVSVCHQRHERGWDLGFRVFLG